MGNAETALEQIAAGIRDIKLGMNRLIKGLRIAAVAGYSGNLLAARIQSAKTDYERNEAVKEANGILEAMKKSLEEPECQTANTSCSART